MNADAGALRAALFYAQKLGWHVFPTNADKTPKTGNGFKGATTEETIIRGWFRQWPGSGVGVRCGTESGIVVVDIDKRQNCDGRKSLRDLGIDYNNIRTPKARTPSGGLHLIFRHTGCFVRNSAGKIGPGIDIRGDGGYVVVPPGDGRHWILPPDTPLPPFPDWAVLKAPASEPIGVGRFQVVRPDGSGVTPYGESALKRAREAIISAPDGTQNATLNREAFGIGQLVAAGHIPQSLAMRALLAAAAYMPSFNSSDPWRPAQVQALIWRAFSDGFRRRRGRAA
jgi:Bifunctional DNA primase/polymerase, N-terminal